MQICLPLQSGLIMRAQCAIGDMYDCGDGVGKAGEQNHMEAQSPIGPVSIRQGRDEES